jgi:hypothetical protein
MKLSSVLNYTLSTNVCPKNIRSVVHWSTKSQTHLAVLTYDDDDGDTDDLNSFFA